MPENDEEVQVEGGLGDEGDDRDAVDLQELGDRALALVQRQATQHPLRTVGIAMGVGYVLGGGVPKLFVRLGMVAAGRALSQAATVEGMRMLAGIMRDRGAGEEATAEATAEAPPSPRANGQRRKRGGHARAARHD